MENDIQQFIENIQEINNKKIKATCISTGKTINCSPLSFKQQKELISTIGENTVGVLKFQKNINDILTQNTGNDELLISDKIPLILKIRCGSIGNSVKIDGEEIDITENVEKAQTITFPPCPTIKGAIIVELGIPTLKEENKIINATIESVKRDGDEAGKNIANIYTFEIVKFIKSVKFGENVINFTNIPVKDRVKIVENTPLSINKQIVKYIESFKEIENNVLKVVIDGEERMLDIDVSFFDN